MSSLHTVQMSIFVFFLILNLNCRNLTDPMYLKYLDVYLLIDL